MMQQQQQPSEKQAQRNSCPHHRRRFPRFTFARQQSPGRFRWIVGHTARHSVTGPLSHDPRRPILWLGALRAPHFSALHDIILTILQLSRRLDRRMTHVRALARQSSFYRQFRVIRWF